MTRIRFVILTAVLALPTSSFAALVTWDFTGEVRAIQGASPSTLATLSSLGVVEGSAFSGQLVFESSTPDIDPSPGWGRYQTAIVSFEFQIGSYHASHPLGSTFAQMDIASDPGHPYGLIQALGGDPIALGLFTTPVLSLVLQRDGAAAPWSDELPLTPPELADLEPFVLGGSPHGSGTGIVLFGNDGNIHGELTSIEVPEPSVLVALLAPLALAASHLRRRSQP